MKKALLLITVVVVVGGWYLSLNDGLGRPDRPARLELGPPLNLPIIRDPHSARFTICLGPIRANCVVDGDTFWFEGAKIRIADIDAPEISEPRCASERQAGDFQHRQV